MQPYANITPGDLVVVAGTGTAHDGRVGQVRNVFNAPETHVPTVSVVPAEGPWLLVGIDEVVSIDLPLRT